MTHQSSITRSDLESMLLDEASEPKALPLSLLSEITNGFSEKQEIGKGGFAVVYKANLKNKKVAVKKMSSAYMYENSFVREVQCLMQVKHKNIVRFLGYCIDTQGNVGYYNGKFVIADKQQRLLCFEYLPGSLDGYIKDASDGLDWKKRYQIIKGICEGLNYLHQINILHLDLKPSNILLDEFMVPKITDFGLSRCFENEQSKVIPTKMGGTLGYLAPEFTSNVITRKFDLYSLGVIILEILTGKKGCQAVEDVLGSWDNRLELSQEKNHREQIRVCAEIGSECTNFDPAKRPVSMKHIMDRLAETEKMEVITGSNSEAPILDVHPLEFRFTSEVHEVALKAVYTTQGGMENTVHGVTSRLSELATRPIIKIISAKSIGVTSLDAHPSEPWIITGHSDGTVRTWNQETLASMGSFKAPVSEKKIWKWTITLGLVSEKNITMVTAVKFVGKQWVLVGTSDGFVHVYHWDCVTQPQKVTSFQDDSIRGLAVHPIKPYVLSLPDMKLRDWDKCWKCIHYFQSGSYQVVFNPEDSNNFASASWFIAEIWSLESGERDYRLSGHSDNVKCLDFFTRDGQQYLVTGSDDCTAKIWDLEKKSCIHTIETIMSRVTCVVSLRDCPYLVTGSQHGLVHVWSSIDFRLVRTVNIEDGGPVHSLVCLAGSRRVVIGQEYAIAVMHIDDIEEAS